MDELRKPFEAQPARKPIESKPARMGALARLPVFLALEGKRVVLVGFGPAAEWKRELLEA
ncbi:MAG: NAD(P)-dependent oxidoreductase, partial [Rhizobiales bacterium]|nr:NAD(P)-dependent oxidoreductase [Hyphomicrobiales bacterium]